MKLAKKLKSNKGFTLVELVVVIAVLAILAGVGSVAYSGYITRAKEATDMSTLAAIQTAAVSACAEKGVVTKITVDKDGVVKATVGSDITLNGSAATVGSESANFKTFIGTNSTKLSSDKFKGGAEWNYGGVEDTAKQNTWVALTTE